VLRCPALAGRITGVSRSVEPLVRHVLISRCLSPTSRAARTRRTSAPSASNRTASPTSGSSPRPSSVDNNTCTSRGPGRMSHRPTDAAAGREVLSLCRQGPNAVERAAILPEIVAPRERWAKLAKWTTAELHGRRSPKSAGTQANGPHATPPGWPRSWPGCPAAPTRSSSVRSHFERALFSCERGWATGRRSGAVCGLRSGAAARKDAELVPLWVGKYDPAHIALADIGVSST